jgi:hypothetical protein
MSTPQAIQRLLKSSRREDVPRDYRGTCSLVDEESRQVLASCDLSGQATFATVSILTPDRRTWTMKPNRKIMPSRWIVSDPGKSIAVEFDQNISQKLINPIYKCLLTLFDGESREIYRVVDPKTNLPDRIFGVGPDGWPERRRELIRAELSEGVPENGRTQIA